MMMMMRLKKIFMVRIYILLITVFLAFQAFSAKFKDNFVSYFASIKSSEVNVRKGPNARYPIEWVYTKKGEPIEVIAQFEHWLRIKDFNGDEGWIKTAMVSKKRTGVIITNSTSKKQTKSYAKVYEIPEVASKIIGNIASSKRVNIDKCNKNWCLIKVANFEGWVEKQNIWGVYGSEEFK